MMLYENRKEKDRSPDGDTDLFDIVAGVLEGDLLAPYLFIISPDYLLWTSMDFIKENGFTIEKSKKQTAPRTIYYWSRLCWWHDSSTQSESLLHSLEWASSGIGLYMDADKTEYMCFNRRGGFSTLNGGSLKLVDKFTY